MKTNLTKEESANLISLGFPKEKASQEDWTSYSPIGVGFRYPIFTLADLLSILPKEIDNNHSLNICYIRNQWWSEYISYITEEAIVQKARIELIDALYELCIWTIENGYLKFE